MAITLDGTNGINSSGVIVAPDGSVSAPAITNDGDTNTGIFFPAADTIAFAEGGAEAMRIDSDGDVGIGTTAPSTRLHVKSGGNVETKIATDSNAYSYLTLNAYALDRAQLRAESANPGAGSGTGSGILSFWTANNSALAERMRLDTSGNLLFNSGYGSVATAYGCRAWVNFDGTGTPAIREDGNVSSITDNGTGDYTVNFSTAMPDVNYAVAGFAGTSTAGTGILVVCYTNTSAYATGSMRFRTNNQNPANEDALYCNVSIFR